MKSDQSNKQTNVDLNVVSVKITHQKLRSNVHLLVCMFSCKMGILQKCNYNVLTVAKYAVDIWE